MDTIGQLSNVILTRDRWLWRRVQIQRDVVDGLPHHVHVPVGLSLDPDVGLGDESEAAAVVAVANTVDLGD